MNDKTVIGSFNDTYKHVEKMNPDTKERGKLGSYFRKFTIGYKAAGVLEKISRLEADVEYITKKAMEEYDHGEITKAEYDQKCGAIKRRLVEEKRKQGYLTEEEALKEFASIKEAHPLDYSGCVIIR